VRLQRSPIICALRGAAHRLICAIPCALIANDPAASADAEQIRAGSLAFQALGGRVKQPVTAALVAVVALAAILWMHAGHASGKFENLLLFVGYWIAPFCAIVMIDWHYNRQRYSPPFLRNALMFGSLGSGLPAIVAFVAATPPWCRS
jgi:purine-cytosine permease-like protein